MLGRAGRRLLAAGAVLAVATGALAGCGKSDKAAETPPVRLGALLPLSGYFAPTGQPMADAYNMAIKEANEAGGVLGRRVEIVFSDDACDPGAAVVGANQLVSEDITVSVGGGCSVAAVPSLKIFRAAGIPMIIPGANSTDLLAPGYDSVFLLAGTTRLEAKQAVEAMGRLGVRRVAVVDDGTSFSDTLASETTAFVKEMDNGTTLTGRQRVSQGATSYPRVVATVLQQRADMVFYTGYYSEAAALIRDLRAAHYTGKIMLADAGTDPALLEQITPAEAEGLLGLSLPVAKFMPQAATWAARYRAAYGREPGPFTMQAYDAARLAINAIGRAGTLDREAVRKAIADTKPGDIRLLSGPSEFQRDGTQVNPTFLVLRAQHGAFVLSDL
ncbi:branched-chain amino acid ABC transporter substrate-binding protein [Catellatospora bangladeshensis]|uniref:Branched chain amino acid ABC transporter substrate-binding protein n=1 Tax=Catellatospora bangladeshensis TaxID=310355 RepID=A0A8J3J9J3_9ACTN|nr:branched-chain amino acid ABC transporter substrate-binding protein [Catellatospora bangladeshensis]GIF80837.1 branched chain amino acid ABC transporter substrate-binding protein [Catellatospora bangladeshensis]